MCADGVQHSQALPFGAAAPQCGGCAAGGAGSDWQTDGHRRAAWRRARRKCFGKRAANPDSKLGETSGSGTSDAIRRFSSAGSSVLLQLSVGATPLLAPAHVAPLPALWANLPGIPTSSGPSGSRSWWHALQHMATLGGAVTPVSGVRRLLLLARSAAGALPAL